MVCTCSKVICKHIIFFTKRNALAFHTDHSEFPQNNCHALKDKCSENSSGEQIERIFYLILAQTIVPYIFVKYRTLHGIFKAAGIAWCTCHVIINPRRACAARVAVVGSVCPSVRLSVKSHLTSGESVRPENAVTCVLSGQRRSKNL